MDVLRLLKPNWCQNTPWNTHGVSLKSGDFTSKFFLIKSFKNNVPAHRKYSITISLIFNAKTHYKVM